MITQKKTIIIYNVNINQLFVYYVIVRIINNCYTYLMMLQMKMMNKNQSKNVQEGQEPIYCCNMFNIINNMN